MAKIKIEITGPSNGCVIMRFPMDKHIINKGTPSTMKDNNKTQIKKFVIIVGVSVSALKMKTPCTRKRNGKKRGIHEMEPIILSIIQTTNNKSTRTKTTGKNLQNASIVKPLTENIE